MIIVAGEHGESDDQWVSMHTRGVGQLDGEPGPWAKPSEAHKRQGLLRWLKWVSDQPSPRSPLRGTIQVCAGFCLIQSPTEILYFGGGTLRPEKDHWRSIVVMGSQVL